MQYTIRISPEPKLKSRVSNEIVLEQIEESKSVSSSSESSLITEEDSLGNPLPQEIITIRRKTKQLEKNLTNELMNLKNSSKHALNSNSQSKYSDTKHFENSMEVLAAVSKNEPLRILLDQIVKLQLEFDNSRKILQKNELEIYEAESEYLSLKKNFATIEENVAEISKTPKTCSKCLII